MVLDSLWKGGRRIWTIFLVFDSRTILWCLMRSLSGLRVSYIFLMSLVSYLLYALFYINLVIKRNIDAYLGVFL